MRQKSRRLPLKIPHVAKLKKTVSYENEKHCECSEINWLNIY
jgi:hypothetical protein